MCATAGEKMKLPNEVELKITQDMIFYKERFVTNIPERIKLTKMAMQKFTELIPEGISIDDGEDWISLTIKNYNPMTVAIIVGNLVNELRLPPLEVVATIAAISGSALLVRDMSAELDDAFENIMKTEEGKSLLEKMIK